MYKVSYLVSLLFLLMVNTLSHAQSLNVDMSKVKFKPSLLENKSPMCASVLGEAQKAFFEIQTDIPAYFLAHSPLKDSQYGSGVLQGLNITINNKHLHLEIIRHPGCGGACERYQLIAREGDVSEEEFQIIQSNDISDAITEKLPPAVSDSKGALYLKNGELYLYTFTDTLQVHQLTENTTWKHLCTISITPDENFNKNISSILKSLKDMETSAYQITGNYGACGSLASGNRRQQEMQIALKKLSYKPWELYGETNSSYQAFWENWSQQGIYESTNYKTFKTQFNLTQKILANYYQVSFGWNKSQSELVASNALNNAIARGFVVRDLIYTNPINKLILAQKSLAEIKAFAPQPSKAKDAYDYSEYPLAAAVTYPEALTYLLKEGFDPNRPNAFGKTPLMYAVQYNQLESTKILLAKGANPNLFTIIPEDTCNFTLSKSNMTALHYAVRYASAELVKLLLNSGANPFASTSETTGGRPIDWLHKYTAQDATEKNNNLTKENIAELSKLLSMPSPEETSRKVLAFNLAAEQAFQKGNLDDAYNKSALALGLDEKNERVLSNLSLILIKQGKQDEALEASNKLITTGRDTNQIANAWFNYGLICEKSTNNYISYNGHSYCRDGATYPFIESFKAKPTAARADKIVSTAKTTKSACEFSSDKNGYLALIQHCGSNNFCILHNKERTITLDTFALLKQSHENPNDLNSQVKITAVKPVKIVESFPLGNYQLTKLARNYGETTVKFGDQICTESSELLPASKYP